MMNPLRTERLLIRPIRADDLDDFIAIFSDPEVCRYLGDGRPRSRERVELSLRNSLLCWERHGFGLCAVEADDVVLGDCMITPIARSGVDATDLDVRGPEIEIGYRLGRSAWGKGYATEAARALLAWAMEADDGPRLPRLVAVAYPENAASRRVLEKIGMRHCGETEAYYDMRLSLFATGAHETA
ncbi:MAG: GNAT family N-acetyltransferase [Planctomycetota bacterium]